MPLYPKAFVCGLLVLFLIINEFSLADAELVLVQSIFRHGARTTFEVYPNDPYINETYFPHGFGELTNEGKKQEYKLGQFYRNQYIDFIGETYNFKKINIRSTHEHRARASGLLVAAGLHPPTKELVWNEELNWQPIPVDYKSKYIEDVYHTRYCPRLDEIDNNLAKNPVIYEKYIKPYKEYYDKLQNFSGKIIENPRHVQELYFILSTEDEQGFTLPEWTKEVYPEPMLEISALTYEYKTYEPESKLINCGYLLKFIIENFENKINDSLEPPEQKILLFSAHETTIGFMQSCLLEMKHKILPPYSSALTFELHRIENDYFIKLRYKIGPDATDYVEIAIPGCSTLCSFEQFKTSYAHLIPKISMEEACSLLKPDQKEAKRKCEL